jgi:hypothetical protein
MASPVDDALAYWIKGANIDEFVTVATGKMTDWLKGGTYRGPKLMGDRARSGMGASGAWQ